jgi:hypothetical protein
LKGFNDDGTFFHFLQDAPVGKNHDIIFSVLCK